MLPCSSQSLPGDDAHVDEVVPVTDFLSVEFRYRHFIIRESSSQGLKCLRLFDPHLMWKAEFDKKTEMFVPHDCRVRMWALCQHSCRRWQRRYWNCRAGDFEIASVAEFNIGSRRVRQKRRIEIEYSLSSHYDCSNMSLFRNLMEYIGLQRTTGDVL